MKNQTKWYSGQVTHEGFPLYLRFPEKPNFEELSKLYPKLLWIEHSLDKVQEDGSPEKDYNSSLIDFDGEVIDLFNEDKTGITVLVETFAGKRTYYIYTSEESTRSKTNQLKQKYPEHTLEFGSQSDQNWEFIKNYSTDFNFY